jgi:DNA-binding CsgD family transcriptional regulator
MESIKYDGFDIDVFASMSDGAVYVIDFREKQFRYVSEHDLFLYGHSQYEILNLGYDFFPMIVHPDDLPLWEEMYAAILRYLRYPEEEEQLKNVNYFSFTLRIKNLSQIPDKQKYLMVKHKLKPIFQDGQIYLGICLLKISAISTSGNLEVFYNDGMILEYSFAALKWKLHDIEPLKDCEIEIIKLSIMGFNEKEIASKLRLKIGTIRNKCSALYQKLNVNSMMQAINVTRDLIYKKSTKKGKKKKT